MAITFDAVTSPGASGVVTEYTFAHTCASTSSFMMIATFVNGTDNMTGITYNGDALTKKGAQDVWQFWYLLGCDSGTNNVVMTRSGAQVMTPTVATYVGVDVAGGLDTNEATDNQGGTIAPTRTTTTTVNNSWAIMGLGKTTTQSGSVGTLRGQGTGDSGAIADNEQLIAGIATVTTTCLAGDTKTWICSIKAGAATGPANLKSLSGNIKANIKSYNTNLIANVKSVNTNV